MEPDEKIGVFRGTYIAARRAEGAQESGPSHVARARAARPVRALAGAEKALTSGRDNGVEGWRPIFAADKLRSEALEELRLRNGGMVFEVVGKLAKKHKIPTTAPKPASSRSTRDDLKTKTQGVLARAAGRYPMFLHHAGSHRGAVGHGHRGAPRAGLGYRRSRDARQPAAIAQPVRCPARWRCSVRRCRQANHSGRHPRAALALWMERGGKTLAANQTTLAIVPLAKLTRAAALERLRARGTASSLRAKRAATPQKRFRIHVALRVLATFSASRV